MKEIEQMLISLCKGEYHMCIIIMAYFNLFLVCFRHSTQCADIIIITSVMFTPSIALDLVTLRHDILESECVREREDKYYVEV